MYCMNINYTSNTILKNIFNIIDKNAIDGIILTGSYALHTNSKYSDIDIILISKNVSYVYAERCYFADNEYQLLFLPYFQSPYILLNDIYRGRGIIISMFKKGEILYDNSSGYITRLIKFIKEDKQHVHLNEHETIYLYEIIERNINDIQNYKTDFEKVFCATEILRTSAKLLTGCMDFTGKHLGRELENSCIYADSLLSSFLSFMHKQDVNSYVTKIRALMPLIDSTSIRTNHYVYTTLNGCNIMIFFPKHTICDQYILLMMREIHHVCPNYKVHSFYEGRNQIMEEGIYLSITSLTEDITEIYSYLEELRSSKSIIAHDIKMIFPFRTLFFDGLSFGGKEILTNLLPYFAQIWKQFESKISYNELSNKQFKNSIFGSYFILCSLKKIFSTKEKRIEFCNLIIEYLLPFAVNPNGFYNINQYNGNKEALLKYHNSFFKELKTENDKLFDSLLSGKIDELKDINCIFQNLFIYIESIPNKSSLFPDIWFTSNRENILLLNIVNHILSIFHISPSDKFSLIFNIHSYISENDF